MDTSEPPVRHVSVMQTLREVPWPYFALAALVALAVGMWLAWVN